MEFYGFLGWIDFQFDILYSSYLLVDLYKALVQGTGVLRLEYLLKIPFSCIFLILPSIHTEIAVGNTTNEARMTAVQPDDWFSFI